MLWVYIDLDGLGADWQGYVTRKHFPGMTIRDLNKSPDRESKLRAMYERDPHLFYNLPPIEKFSRIIDTVKALPVRWAVLTSAGQDHHDYELVRNDKVRYLSRHFDVPEKNVIVTKSSADKVVFAKSTSLLIDDYDKNCEEFVAAGGNAIHVESQVYEVERVVKLINQFVLQ